MSDFQYRDERFADIQMLRYAVPGFEALTLRQKKLVYYLSEAALSGRDILWDQNCRYNLRIRKLLETVAAPILLQERQDVGLLNDEEKALLEYLKRVWFANGIHHHYAMDKFKPGFSRSFLEKAILGAGLSVDEELMEVIFNPEILSKRVNQTAGEDLLLTSAMNYYAPDVTQSEAEVYYADKKNVSDPHPVMHGMNCRLEHDENGRLRENTYRSGGLYGEIIDRIVSWLEKAQSVAENDEQTQVLATLIDFYRTGDLHTFDEYCIRWVKQQQGDVDFTNGFTEVYGDPLGIKASWEGFVNFKDHKATERTERLSANAQWFEDHSTTDALFKKKSSRGVTAKVITAAMLGGDLYPSSAIGINLPNSNWIRQEYGSKSVTIGNLTHAYARAAKGNGFREEFVDDTKTLELLNRYEDELDDLHTDLHECLGHGSGQLLPGVDPDALKAYGSTIEEARADLFALYFIADDKMLELGLVPDSIAYKSQYYSYMMNGLMTQLVRIEPGCQIEEAHMRNRALIARWVMLHSEGAMQLKKRSGKTFLHIADYDKVRLLVGELLAEVQRIKSEGDYESARQLVEDYGVKVDPVLHQEMLERYHKLNLAPYKGFINPRFLLVKDENGEIADVKIEYGESYAEQMLRYSIEY